MNPLAILVSQIGITGSIVIAVKKVILKGNLYSISFSINLLSEDVRPSRTKILAVSMAKARE